MVSRIKKMAVPAAKVGPGIQPVKEANGAQASGFKKKRLEPIPGVKKAPK